MNKKQVGVTLKSSSELRVRFYSLERSSPLLDIGQKTWDMGLGTYDIGHGTCEISHWSSVMSYETWNKDIGHGIFEIR